MGRLLCVGDLNVDIAITLADGLADGSDTAGRIEMFGGGSAANVAAWAATCGTPTDFIGVLGDDTGAALLVEELAGHGVHVHPIVRPHSRSRAIAAIIGIDGNRSLVSDLDSIDGPTVEDFSDAWLDDITWLHLTAYTYIAPASRELFTHVRRAATARSIRCSIDPSAAQLLRTNCDRSEVLAAFDGAHVLFPSHDEAAYLTGLDHPRAGAEALLDLADIVAVTCGAAGAHVAQRGHPTFHVPAHDVAAVRMVNTLGCGDAFAGGFITAMLDGRTVAQSAGFAVDTATRALQIPSAR